VIRLEMPALRDRPEDLRSLIHNLLQQIASRLGVGVPDVPEALMTEFARHDWPGNVRELANVLERFVVQSHAGLLEVSSPSKLIGKPPSMPIRVDSGFRAFPRAGAAEEKRFLEEELAAVGGNIAGLARKLGIARSTLRYRISRHSISR